MKFFHTYSLFESLKQAEDIAKSLGINVDSISVKKNLKDIVDKLGQPNLKYLPVFIKMLRKQDINPNTLDYYTDLIKKYRINIQQSGVDINSFEKEEQLFDFFTKLEEESGVKKLMNMVPKYIKNLMTGQEERFKNLFLLLYKLISENKEKSEADVKEFLFNKISRNKTAEELYNHIKGYIDGVSGDFSVDVIVSKVESVDNASVIYKDDKVVIAEIGDFAASAELGKDSSWCISQEEHYFKDYVRSLNKQYFIWDTSKEREDPVSMIGVTVVANGYISACQKRNDEPLDDTYIDKWKKYIVPNVSESELKKFNVGVEKNTWLSLTEIEGFGYDIEDLKDANIDELNENFPEIIEHFSSYLKVTSTNLIRNESVRIGYREYTEYDDDDFELVIDVVYNFQILAQNMAIAVHFADGIIRDIAENPVFYITSETDDEEVTEENYTDYL